jgi:hypothetical protein
MGSRIEKYLVNVKPSRGERSMDDNSQHMKLYILLIQDGLNNEIILKPSLYVFRLHLNPPGLAINSRSMDVWKSQNRSTVTCPRDIYHYTLEDLQL